MKRFLLALFLLLATNIGAHADVADCHNAIKAAGIPLDGVSGSGPTDPNLRVDCSQCTSAQSTQALQMAQTASNWMHITRNLPAFIAAVRTDASTTPQLRQQLALILPQVTMDYSNPSAMRGDWQDAITTYGPSGTNGTWLTTGVQSMVHGYAVQYNIPITSDIQ